VTVDGKASFFDVDQLAGDEEFWRGVRERSTRMRRALLSDLGFEEMLEDAVPSPGEFERGGQEIVRLLWRAGLDHEDVAHPTPDHVPVAGPVLCAAGALVAARHEPGPIEVLPSQSLAVGAALPVTGSAISGRRRRMADEHRPAVVVVIGAGCSGSFVRGAAVGVLCDFDVFPVLQTALETKRFVQSQSAYPFQADEDLGLWARLVRALKGRPDDGPRWEERRATYVAFTRVSPAIASEEPFLRRYPSAAETYQHRIPEACWPERVSRPSCADHRHAAFEATYTCARERPFVHLISRDDASYAVYNLLVMASEEIREWPRPSDLQFAIVGHGTLPAPAGWADEVTGVFPWLMHARPWCLNESNRRLGRYTLSSMSDTHADALRERQANPRVFVSHGSEDKERFVVPLARQLMSRGIDVWLDKWEMLPGDSLVRKIFTEGLDAADAVIVVVSSTSMSKRWVAEELDAAVVKRIEQDARLIPIVLDGVEVASLPPAIRHLLHVRADLESPGSIEAAADAVVRAVLGRSDKPMLGGLPRYATAAVASVPGLDRIDELVLKAAGDEAVQQFKELLDTVSLAASLAASHEVTQGQVLESLEVLDADGIVELHRTMGRGIDSMSSFALTWHGIETYANAFVDGYESLTKEVVAYIAGSGKDQGTDEEVATAVSHPRLLVLHVMRLLDAQGLLVLSQSLGPWTHYINPSPKLRRLALG
jgi:hypothetical protein